MKEKAQLSMVALCEAKSKESFESDDERRKIEMAALLTVIRENIAESGKTKFKYADLVDQSVDLTVSLLHHSYTYEGFKGPPISSSVWSLIISNDLIMEDNKYLICTEKLKEALLRTLPQELSNRL